MPQQLVRAVCLLILGPLGIGLTAQQSDAIAKLTAEFDERLQRGFPPDAPGVAVIATRGGEVVFRRAYGKASLELDVAMAPDMTFCLASVTKPFTATAAMLLVEDGRLRLDESVVARLEGLEIDDRITVEHLLSHTSGLPDFFGIDGYGPDHLHSVIEPGELCRAANGQALRFEPGERYEYSNLNYALAARIVEVASGKSWEAFLQERVFVPAGMSHTMFGGDRRIVARAVTNYQKSGDGWLRAQPLSYTRGYGLGGLFSTVDDLATFDAALRGGKILNDPTLERMERAPRLADGNSSSYALGWRVEERFGHRFVHHSGGIHGWRTHIVSIPASKVFVAVLSNRGESRSPVGGVGMMIARGLAEVKDD